MTEDACLDGITNSMDKSLSKLQEILKPGVLHAVHAVTQSQTQLSDSTTTINKDLLPVAQGTLLNTLITLMGNEFEKEQNRVMCN